jgi:large subunit ribosomal protein L25
MQLEFNAKKRDGQGTGASRRLRRTGRVPGILYGGSAAPQQIDIDHNELFQLLRKEAFYSSVLNANVDGAKEMCLLRDVQRHPYKQQILHVDFQRIDAGTRSTRRCRCTSSMPTSPRASSWAAAWSRTSMNDVDVKCLPKPTCRPHRGRPQGSRCRPVDPRVADRLPKGVELVHHGEGDPVVASMLMKGGSAVEEAEPQVVARPFAAAPAKKAERVDKR